MGTGGSTALGSPEDETEGSHESMLIPRFRVSGDPIHVVIRFFQGTAAEMAQLSSRHTIGIH